MRISGPIQNRKSKIPNPSYLCDMEFISQRLDDLLAPAQHLAALLKDMPMAVFEGEMGAGKTTFIKAVCKELGAEDDVSSPTFSLVNEYRQPNGTPIFHFDFYRIKAISEAEDMGIYEYFDSGICLIEWGERISEILKNENFIQVKISVRDEKRFITFEKYFAKS